MQLDPPLYMKLLGSSALADYPVGNRKISNTAFVMVTVSELGTVFSLNHVVLRSGHGHQNIVAGI